MHSKKMLRICFRYKLSWLFGLTTLFAVLIAGIFEYDRYLVRQHRSEAKDRLLDFGFTTDGLSVYSFDGSKYPNKRIDGGTAIDIAMLSKSLTFEISNSDIYDQALAVLQDAKNGGGAIKMQNIRAVGRDPWLRQFPSEKGSEQGRRGSGTTRRKGGVESGSGGTGAL